MSDKQNIRAAVLARRDAMDASVRAAKSETICRAAMEAVESGLAGAAGGADGLAGGGAGSGADGLSDAGEPVTGGPVVGARTGRAPLVAAYAAMRSEVDVRAFVEAAYDRGWDVCFPCMVRDEPEPKAPSRMAFYRVPRERLEEAREAFLGHPLRRLGCDELAAAGYAAVDPCEIDAVLVPLVAFDEAGNRLGYGGGNYDRLLPRLRPDAVAVGVAFAEQQVDSVPTEPHDRPLPHVASA